MQKREGIKEKGLRGRLNNHMGGLGVTGSRLLRKKEEYGLKAGKA